MEMAKTEEAQALPWVTPFYALRSFLDAEYSVILGFGFYKLAEQLIKLRSFFESIKRDGFSDPKFLFDQVMTNTSFHDALMATLYMLIIFIMLIDDFARRRILTSMAPCRSMGRFALDVIIGFFFGLCFLMIPEKSSVMWGVVGLAYIIGGIWSNRVLKESMAWEKNRDTADRSMRSSVSNWTLYQARLFYMVWSHSTFGAFLTLLMGLLVIFDLDIGYSWYMLFLFFLAHALYISANMITEHRLKAMCPHPDGAPEKGMLVTIAPIPRSINKFYKQISIDPFKRGG